MTEYIETIHGTKLEVIDNLEDCYYYDVWNIGRHNFLHKNYIPLCQPLEGYNINKNTLKAFRMPTEELALYFLDKASNKAVHVKDIIKEMKF